MLFGKCGGVVWGWAVWFDNVLGGKNVTPRNKQFDWMLHRGSKFKDLHHGDLETWPQDISQTPACPAPRSPLGLSSRHPTLPFWGPLFHSLHTPFSFLILLSIPHHAEAYLCVLKSSLRGISVFDSAKELANFWKSGLAVGDFELS